MIDIFHLNIIVVFYFPNFSFAVFPHIFIFFIVVACARGNSKNLLYKVHLGHDREKCQLDLSLEQMPHVTVVLSLSDAATQQYLHSALSPSVGKSKCSSWAFDLWLCSLHQQVKQLPLVASVQTLILLYDKHLVPVSLCVQNSETEFLMINSLTSPPIFVLFIKSAL